MKKQNKEQEGLPFPSLNRKTRLDSNSKVLSIAGDRGNSGKQTRHKECSPMTDPVPGRDVPELASNINVWGSQDTAEQHPGKT